MGQEPPENEGIHWKIDGTGKLIFIDWDKVEKMAQAHLDNIRRDPETIICLMAVAVREAVLTAKVPSFGEKK